MKARIFGVAVLAFLFFGFITDLMPQWSNQSYCTKLKLNFVAFLDESSALISGEQGTVLYTNNQGESWGKKKLPTNQALNGISIVQSTVGEDYLGYIVGDGGKIYKRDKRDLHEWIDISVDSDFELKSVVFRNSLHGIAVGQKHLHKKEEMTDKLFSDHACHQAAAAILVTMDGGITWTEKIFPVRATFNSVVILGPSNPGVDKYTAIAVGDKGLFAISKDGGSKWNLRDMHYTINFNKVEFRPFNFGIIVGENGTLLISNDNGENWEEVRSEYLVFNIRSICSCDGHTFTAVGEAYSGAVDPCIKQGVIMESKDYGKTWKEVCCNLGGSYNYIEFCNRQWGIAIGNNGAISKYQYKDPDQQQYFTDNHTSLISNYPNPFNPTTKISYRINNADHVKISVLNTLGEEVAILVDQFMDGGTHEVEFNAANLPSGVYFYRLKSGSFIETKKMLLLR